MPRLTALRRSRYRARMDANDRFRDNAHHPSRLTPQPRRPPCLRPRLEGSHCRRGRCRGRSDRPLVAAVSSHGILDAGADRGSLLHREQPASASTIAGRLTRASGTTCERPSRRRPASRVRNALVEIWHCDAVGLYSGFERLERSSRTFLRGGQRTDAKGLARLTTIDPGWYQGRTVHIHVKVHIGEQRRPHGSALLQRRGNGRPSTARLRTRARAAHDPERRRLDLQERRQPLAGAPREGRRRQLRRDDRDGSHALGTSTLTQPSSTPDRERLDGLEGRQGQRRCPS